MIETLTLADLCQSRPPFVLSPEDPLGPAVAAMGERRISSVVLAIAGRPVGIFTERDALSLLARGAYDPSSPLRERMSPDLLTATPELTFAEGYARMSARGCRHLVLVDSAGQLVGVLSETDFARILGGGDLLGEQRVADLMTRDPVNLPPEVTVAEALRIMVERRISSVVVAEAGRAIGILSERDAVRLAGSELDLGSTPLARRMSLPLQSIGADRPAREAGTRMRELGIRRLVVEDEQGRLVGILTRRDLLKDVQEIYLKLLRRVIAVQGEALQDAEDELRELNQWKRMLEQCGLPGLILADSGGVIRFINDAALRALGLTAESSVRLGLDELLDAAGLAESDLPGRLAAARDLTVELPRESDSGRRWLRILGTETADDLGSGVVLAIQDITEERAAPDRTVLQPSSDHGARRHRQLVLELRQALERGEFNLLYQPIIGLATATIVGVEALMRWQHPRDGLLVPRDFLAGIEQSDLAQPVGRWVLEEAAKQARDWLNRGRVRIHVNLSARQLADPGLAREIREVLDRIGLPPELICLEVRETLLPRNPVAGLAPLAELRELGVAIALDNFGTGHITASQLKQLPIDLVKIDKGFIRYMDRDPIDQSFVCSTIDLAHEQGLLVVAEGVETREQLESLSLQGCDQIQGFLMSRLVEAEAIAAEVDGRDEFNPVRDRSPP